jgi:hypothetical protein
LSASDPASADLVVRGRRVVTAGGTVPAAVVVRGGVIAAVTEPGDEPAGLPVVDAGDAVVMPGVVDSHVHVNEPGRTGWEGFATATRAAAAGGVTTLVDMPLNSVPATTDAAALAAKRRAAAGGCWVDVGFWGGVVPGNRGELAGLWAAGVLGFKAFLCPSGVDEFPAIGDAELRGVVPVHRVGTRLLRQIGVLEVLGAMAQHVGETAPCALPLRAAMPEALGDVLGAHQAAVNRRGAGDERCIPRAAALVHRPGDGAFAVLHADDEVHGAVEHRPHLREEARVGPGPVQTPQARRDVGGMIGLAGPVHDRTVTALRRPGTEFVLRIGQKAKGRARFAHPPRHRQTHRRMHVVPGIALAAAEPRDLPVVLLLAGDEVGAARDLRTSQDVPGETGHAMPSLVA